MKRINIFLGLLTIFAFSVSCNNSGPYIFPNYHAVGTVIGSETCHIEKGQDYWLVSIFSSSSKRQDYGNPLVIDGVQYTNVIKVSGLADNLKVIGEKVGIEFTIDETVSPTIGCDVSSAIIYKLKLAYILRSRPSEF